MECECVTKNYRVAELPGETLPCVPEIHGAMSMKPQMGEVADYLHWQRDTRSHAPTFGRLGSGCLGLISLSALNVPPHAIVAHSHLIT
jgi:hypothetical protein